jgi:hypothetical protein
MSNRSTDRVPRRIFLKGGSALLVAAAFGGLNVRELIVRARANDKKVLTDRTLNDFIQSFEGNTKERASMAREAQADLRGFLSKYFELTARQRQELTNLSSQHRQEINDAIKRTLERSYTFRVAMEHAPAGDGFDAEAISEVRAAEGLRRPPLRVGDIDIKGVTTVIVRKGQPTKRSRQGPA